MSEEVAIQQTQGRMRQDVSLKVQEELSIAGITEATIEALREEVKALKDHEVNSDADLKPVQAVLTKCVRMGSDIRKAIEPGKKWAHMLHRAYTSNENEFTGTIDEIAAPLKAKKAAYQARKEQEEHERLQREQERINARNRELEELGFVFRSADGMGEASYRLADTTIIASTIADADDEQWENLTRSARMVADEARAKKEAEEAAARAEADRIEMERRELNEREARLKGMILAARVAELKGMGMVDEPGGYLTVPNVGPLTTTLYRVVVDALPGMAEMEYEATKGAVRMTIEKRDEQARIAKINEERKAELLALGGTESAERDTVVVPDGPNGDVVYIVNNLYTYEDWGRKIELAKSGVALHKEYEARKRLIAERTEKLMASGHRIMNDGHAALSADGVELTSEQPVGDMDDDTVARMVERGQAELAKREAAAAELLRKEGEKRERLRIAAEAERLRIADERRAAQMNDSEKWEQFVEAVKAAAPAMSSEIGKHAVKRVLAGLEAMTPSLLSDLKK